MGRWAERAAELAAEASIRRGDDASDQANGANGTNGMGALPLSVSQGLMRLRTMRPPRRLLTPANWAGVVADAEALVVEGWAGQALRLGWQPIELFGVSDDFDGLAVWLNARKMVLLDERMAIAIDIGGRSRFYFNRRAPDRATVMLWEWAR